MNHTRISIRHGMPRQVLLREIIIGLLIILVVTLLLSACRFYKVDTVDPLDDKVVVEEVKKTGKYIVLHQADQAWHLKNIVVNDSTRTLYGSLEALPLSHTNFRKDERTGKPNAFKKASKEDSPIFEVHVYVSNFDAKNYGPISIPFDAVQKLEVHDRHVPATVASTIALSIVGAAAVVLIIAAIKSSCPFVYINYQDSYQFTGEMFGGAIYPSLERDDYMPLPHWQVTDGQIKLRISNELLERQYTNLANLIVVQHAENTRVLIDKKGKIQTITSPTPTLEAVSGTNHYEREVAMKDSVAFLFDSPAQGDISSLIMSFTRPPNAMNGKLALNAKNSFWLDYAYGKLNEQFGTYYNTFAEKQRKEPARKLHQWGMDQSIPLSVYVHTKKGWKFVDYFNSIGPLASRDIVMPIDLSEVEGQEVKVKLESGFMFWEVDYAAMDFSDNMPVLPKIIPLPLPSMKMEMTYTIIAATDDKYLMQPDIGNVVMASYPAETRGRQVRSIFLHSRGYYEYIRDYKNTPNLLFLLDFKNKGAFPKFSREMYQRLISNNELYAAALTEGHEN